MARTYTVAELITRLDDECDTVNDTHVTQAEKIRYLDNAYARVWGKLADTSPPDHFITDVTFNTVANQKPYALATIAPTGDFWKVKAVYVDEGSGQLRPLRPINEWQIQAYRAPQGVFPMQLSYIKTAPKLTSTADVVDGIIGWEELLVMYAIMDIKRKKQDDYGGYGQKAKELERDIARMGYRDAGFGEAIVRRKTTDPYFVYRNNVDGYRLRGTNLELYYRSGYLAVP